MWGCVISSCLEQAPPAEGFFQALLTSPSSVSCSILVIPFRCAGFCGLVCMGVDVALNLVSLPSWQDCSQLSVTHSSRVAVSEFKLVEFAVQFPLNCLAEMKFPMN